MKTNLTLKLDSDLVREVRVLAAERGKSISSLVAGQIEAMIREQRGYEEARRKATALMRKGLYLRWNRPASRADLHER